MEIIKIIKVQRFRYNTSALRKIVLVYKYMDTDSWWFHFENVKKFGST